MLIIFWYTQKKTTLPEFQFTEFLPQTTTPKLYIRLYRGCLLFIVICCFFVLSFPKRTQSKNTLLKSGIDIVIALDVSYSMEANDLTPNRLDSAKRALQQFLSTRSTDRVGLVLFAGKPFTSVPLTFDYQIFDEILRRITTSTINQNYQHLQGTAIGDALLSSIALLEKETNDTES
jgi:Ca-activated chloride channel family protein